MTRQDLIQECQGKRYCGNGDSWTPLLDSMKCLFLGRHGLSLHIQKLTQPPSMYPGISRQLRVEARPQDIPLPDSDNVARVVLCTRLAYTLLHPVYSSWKLGKHLHRVW